ncbi:MAG: DUF1887 family protein [Sulfurimonas sp.]|nr:DUF1887 family protein [Sulfurimonas sp.]
MTLVSILGDFHSSILPIFYDYKDRLNTHLLVYDDSKKDVQNAKNVNNGIKKFIKKNNSSLVGLNYKLDEDSIEALDRCAQYILTLSDNPSDIYINTTDGYATLTTILNNKLFNKGVNFIAYDMFDNQYNILNSSGLTTKNIEKNMNIVDHFLLKGYKVEKSSLKVFAEKNAKNIKKIFEKMSEKYDDFTKLDSYIYPTIDDLRGRYEHIKQIILEMDSSFSVQPVKHPLFTGTLFECYIYLVVKEMEFDDIEIGMEISRKYKNSYIKNEFDILIMKDNHLHMIECKFKNFIKLDELVYKYIALASTIDEDGKMAIVTKKPPLYNEEIDLHEAKGLTYKRGKLSNIYFYGNVHKNKTKFQKEIKELFNI